MIRQNYIKYSWVEWFSMLVTWILLYTVGHITVQMQIARVSSYNRKRERECQERGRKKRKKVKFRLYYISIFTNCKYNFPKYIYCLRSLKKIPISLPVKQSYKFAYNLSFIYWQSEDTVSQILLLYSAHPPQQVDWFPVFMFFFVCIFYFSFWFVKYRKKIWSMSAVSV